MKLVTPLQQRLYRYLRPYLFPYVVLLAVAMLILAGANAGIPFIIKKFLDELVNLKRGSGLHELSILLAGLFLLRALGNFVNDYLGAYIPPKLVLAIRAELNQPPQ